MIATLWAVAGLLLVAAEFAVPGLVIIFFGLGALLNAVAVAVVPPLAARIPLQFLTWLGASTFAFVALRRRFARVFKGEAPQTDDQDDVGRSAQVLEAVGPERPGRVSYAGSSWRALSFSETIEPGVTVTVLKKEGLTLYVTSDPILGGPFDQLPETQSPDDPA